MSLPKDRSNRAWVEHWRRAGPLLERARRDELRRFKYEESAAAIDALLWLASKFGQRRDTSGLVEQQRLFQKARR